MKYTILALIVIILSGCTYDSISPELVPTSVTKTIKRYNYYLNNIENREVFELMSQIVVGQAEKEYDSLKDLLALETVVSKAIKSKSSIEEKRLNSTTGQADASASGSSYAGSNDLSVNSTNQSLQSPSSVNNFTSDIGNNNYMTSLTNSDFKNSKEYRRRLKEYKLFAKSLIVKIEKIKKINDYAKVHVIFYDKRLIRADKRIIIMKLTDELWKIERVELVKPKKKKYK